MDRHRRLIGRGLKALLLEGLEAAQVNIALQVFDLFCFDRVLSRVGLLVFRVVDVNRRKLVIARFENVVQAVG